MSDFRWLVFFRENALLQLGLGGFFMKGNPFQVEAQRVPMNEPNDL
jgi:hypothetical protein